MATGHGDLDGWTRRDIDLRTPNVARMYDYVLGGKDNFAADRETAEQVLAHVPNGRDIATENRRFLGRAVGFLAGAAGVWQFLDVGAGLPTQTSVHEIAAQAVPEARVCYVDHDPVVCAHARALLANNNPHVEVVEGDLREPDRTLSDPGLDHLIDFTRPVAVLLAAVLHFLTDDDDPYDVVARFRRALSSGSYLVVSHVEACPRVKAVEGVYEQASSRVEGRTTAQIARFFTGLRMVSPGLAYVQNWRPDGGEYPGDLLLGGVGYKP